MTASKRLTDLLLVLFLAPLLLPALLLACVVLWARQGRPIFYLSERMRAPGQPFTLWKLRTMHQVARDSGVSGGDKVARITPLGALLRRSRMDELPQLWNILRGDISFVGPRPPLRLYVERFPALYADVLRARPGVTGLASLVYAGHEAQLLARCRTAEETDASYARNCVPRKARIDLIYHQHHSVGFDLWLIAITALRVLGMARGKRLPRPPRW